ncbi:MAG: hypothetical protein ACLTEU_12310 [Roseburia inulinivorans]
MPTRILVGWLTGLFIGDSEDENPIYCINHGRKFMLSAFEYDIVYGYAGDWFYQTEYISHLFRHWVSAIVWFVLAFVGINGLVETVVCFVVGTAISATLKRH